MTASAYRVWRAPPSRARARALALWWTQLAANAAWSPLFFAAHRPRAALADLALLLGAVGLYASQARRVDSAAAWMNAPYAARSGFASVLNAEIIRFNSDLSG
jgi:tryptophan-rich sensory protein